MIVLLKRFFLPIFALALALLPGNAPAAGSPDRALGAQLAASIDAGDAYATPYGPRQLRRLPDAIALPAGRAPGGFAPASQGGHGLSVFKPAALQKQSRREAPARLRAELQKLRATAAGRTANPVFIDPDTGLRVLVTTNLILCLKPGIEARAYFGKDWARVQPLSGTTDQFLLAMPDATAEEMFTEVNRRAAHPSVAWAEPDFVQQMKRNYTPNDARFSHQWNLENTGQYNTLPGADANLPEAWDITLGHSNIVIAVIDDGVQISHPDLAANIFRNPGELPTNGRDDDNNGRTDDWRGWDFFLGRNDPSPDVTGDYHGTSVAGIAAAVGNNFIGISGAAPGCRILPLKVFSGEDSITTSLFATVVRYAAGLGGGDVRPWRGADIINISLTFARNSVIDSALTAAATKGRQGRGCPIFCAAGNSAAAWRLVFVDIPYSGNHSLVWQFSKDNVDTRAIGANTVWLDNVTYPDGTYESFEYLGLPTGWTTGGDATWTQVTDGVKGNHAYTGLDGPGSHAMRAGKITHDEVTWLQFDGYLQEGLLTFWVWTESEAASDRGYDFFDFFLNDELYDFDYGVPVLKTAPSYPASHAHTFAVGASTDYDFRADYSQYGSKLDFVAPSDGGYAGITTTDLTAASGQNTDPTSDGDYSRLFGGTSAAAPLAAGITALVLSVNPYLTVAELRALLRSTCDHIGLEFYNAQNRSTHYGSGRLNAARAVALARPDLSLLLASQPDPVVVGDTSTYTLTLRNNGTARSGPVRITQQLPAGVVFGSAKPSPAFRSGNLLTFTNTSLARDGVLTFKIVVTNLTLGSQLCTASVTNDVPEPNLADNTAEAASFVLPVPIVSISDATFDEPATGSVNAVFEVTLSNPSSRTVTVRFATAAQTATSKRDFTSRSGVLTFQPGETSKTFTIRILSDALNEDDETFLINLTGPVNASLGTAQGIGTILDHDPLPTVAISDASITEGNSGAASAQFRVKLSPVSGRVVTARFATASGSAREGEDFLGSTNTLIFQPGQTVKTIPITVLGEAIQETSETFLVTLSDPTHATITDSEGIGTIVNTDKAPKLFLGNATVMEAVADTTNAIFQLRLVPASGLTVSVSFYTTNGTATSGLDYSNQAPQILLFAPGETNLTISVPVFSDALSESNETFFVRLLQPTNATLGQALGLGTILDRPAPPAPAFRPGDALVLTSELTTNGVRLRFRSVSGQSYRVESTINLGDEAAWKTLPGFASIAGTGAELEIIAPRAPEAPRSFYRVRQLP